MFVCLFLYHFSSTSRHWLQPESCATMSCLWKETKADFECWALWNEWMFEDANLAGITWKGGKGAGAGVCTSILLHGFCCERKSEKETPAQNSVSAIWATCKRRSGVQWTERFFNSRNVGHSEPKYLEHCR